MVSVDDTPIETQGHWRTGVTVKNGRDAVQLSLDPTNVHANAEQLKVSVAATTAGPVVVMHNGREVGRQAQGQGEVSIPASKLGKGPVTIIAHTLGKVKLRSQPVRFTIP